MEENNTPNQNLQQGSNQNQQFNNYITLKNLPNSTGAMVLGIISIFFSMIWCYWIGSIISLTCGIIGLVLAKSGQKLLEANENQYTLSSSNNNNAGKIMSIIGICLASIELLVLIVVLLFFGTLVGMGANANKWPY
jgi:Na+/H+-translocating membrane pyrophosphatase